MKVPEKIYVHEASAPELTEKLPYHIEYIRKDAIATEKSPKWSEEDENMFYDAIGAVGSADYYTYDDKVEMKRWLKSLKERYTWKPSDEQMEVLKELVEDNNQRHFYTTLNSLYEQLKRLKGE